MGRITEKNFRNKRFRKSEEAILEAFFGNKEILSVRVIAKRAKVSRATFYRHHKAAYNIISDYEDYILEKYNRVLSRLVKKMSLKVIFHQMLMFILMNQKIFMIILEKGRGEILGKMIEEFESRIKEDCVLPKNSEKMIHIYKKEVEGLIENWIKCGVKKCEVDELLSDIMYLTKTMRKRLMPLISND